MKSILTKIQILGLLIALPALANDVGLHKDSAQPTRATAPTLAQASNSKSIEFEDDCREVGNTAVYANSAYNNFVVGGAALSSLGYKFSEITKKFDLPEQVRTSFNMYVISGPTHGELFQTAEDKRNMLYSYRADGGYVGKDSFVIGVDTLTKSGKSIHFKIKFKLSVVEQITNENEQSTCIGMKFNSASARVGWAELMKPNNQ